MGKMTKKMVKSIHFIQKLNFFRGGYKCRGKCRKRCKKRRKVLKTKNKQPIMNENCDRGGA